MPQAPPPSRTSGPRHSPMIRCISCVLLGLIVLVGLIVLITWLVVHPKKPSYTIEEGSITGYTLTKNDRLNASFHFVLRANNPNEKMSLYYDNIDVTVSYRDQVLSFNNVHPFYQPRRNVTRLDMYLMAKDAVVYGDVGRDLRMDRAAGEVGLDVKIRAKMRLKVGVLKIHRKMKVSCGPVMVASSNSSSSKGFQRVFCDGDID